jgi:hypothetical protein
MSHSSNSENDILFKIKTQKICGGFKFVYNSQLSRNKFRFKNKINK